MSKVSIIIPAYNQARFLGQAIASALGQEQAEVEVIVVDDGSTDDTPAVVASFADNPNLKSIRQPNTGLPGARNRGLAEATGDYVCFLDSDDYYAPAKAARQARMLDENPALGFVYCDIITVDPSGQPLPDQFSIGRLSRPLSGNIFQSLMEGGYFPPHAVMIRRGILAELGGFDPALGGHADYELWLRVSGAGHPPCYQDEPLAFYRTHPDSMSKDGLHMQETRVATFAKIARLHPDEVHDRPPLGRARRERDLVDLLHVDLPLVGEEEDVRVRRRHEELVTQSSSRASLPIFPRPPRFCDRYDCGLVRLT